MDGREVVHHASLELFSDVRRRLAKAVLLFQDRFVDLRVDSGSLVQVWLPERLDEGQTLLRTKGLPFCVAGAGDLLALFRCISCRYKFATNLSQTDLLGAPGRVFSTGVAEMSRNVQQYSKEIYLRASEAQQCQIQSTIVLPLFDSQARDHTVGVLEVVQTSNDMPFSYVISTLDTILQGCQLWTCDSDAPCSREMSESSDTVRAIADHAEAQQTSGEVSWSPAQMTEEASSSKAEARPQVSADKERQQQQQQQARQKQPLLAPPDPPVALTQPNAPPGTQAAAAAPPSSPCERMSTSLHPRSSAGSLPHANSRPLDRESAQRSQAAAPPAQTETLDDALDEGSDLEDGEGETGADDDDMDAHPTAGGARRGKGTGNPGKPGKRLRLADLQGQFGVGLKEAANRLGICPTTLKRACRRHGIQRWPRRQLLKLSKAIDQINATTNAEHEAEEKASARQAPVSNTDDDRGNVGDGRWTQLAQLIPGLQSQLHEPAAQQATDFHSLADAPMGQASGRQSSHDAAQASSMRLPGMQGLHLDPMDSFVDSPHLFGTSYEPHPGQTLAGTRHQEIQHGSQPSTSNHLAPMYPSHTGQMLSSVQPLHKQTQGPVNGFAQQAQLDWQDELLAPYSLHFASMPHSMRNYPAAAKDSDLGHLRDGASNGYARSQHSDCIFNSMPKLKPSLAMMASGDSLGAEDLHDDVGIVDQSVLDLLLETPA